MARVPRDPQELRKQLLDQLQFLRTSSAAFDAGAENEAKRLATTLRLLLHDTASSHSLLRQLDIKDNLEFHDLSLPFDPTNLLSHSALTKLVIGPEAALPLPLFDDSPIPPRKLPFAEWWNGVVFVDTTRVQYSRRDIVLAVANQDGGAHVDPELDEHYSRLTRGNALGWIHRTGGRDERPLADQVPAAIRHIAHELLKSLDPTYVFSEPEPTVDGVVITGPSVHFEPTPPGPPRFNVAKALKVGRNDPCPCGSGRKFKRCCGP